jgi:viroplasmin and RNaseH domain-containing protein
VGSADGFERTVTAVTDSQGHSYDVVQEVSSNVSVFIAAAVATSGLTTSHSVSINWSSSTDTIAQVYAIRGVELPNVGEDTDAYTESTTYSQSVTASESGVMIAAFAFPDDYLFGGVTISGFTKLIEDDHLHSEGLPEETGHSLQAYYDAVSSGVNICSKTIGASVAHVSAGVVLPYGTPEGGGGGVVRRRTPVMTVGF